MNNNVVTKEARQFYAMIALLKCSQTIGDYLLTTPERTVHRTVKKEMNELMKRLKLFHRSIEQGIDKEYAEQWQKDWQRDYLSFSCIFEFMADMNDQQREVLEEFAGQLMKGNVQAELKK